MIALLERIRSSLDTNRSFEHQATLITLILLAIVVRIAGFQGYSDSDPRSYTLLANKLAGGVSQSVAYDEAPVFPFRIGVYWPAALLIHSFGLSEVSIVAYPFAISIAGCILAYFLARHFWGPLAGLICLGIWAVLPIDMKLASLLLPDATAAFWANIGIALLLLGSTKARPHGLACAIVAGLFLGISWLCKETVVYILPFIVVLILIFDRNRPIGKRVVTALAVAAGTGVVLAAEMIVFTYLTDDPFHRLHSIERNYSESALWFYDPSSPYFGWETGGYGRVMFYRLFVRGPFELMTTKTGYLPAYAMAGLVWMWLFAKRRMLILLGIWLLSLLILFNFMTISFQAYRPLPLFGRYLYPLLLPASICFAGFLYTLISQSPPHTQRSRAFGSVILGLSFLAISAPQFHNVLTERPEEVERSVAKMMKESDVIFSDYRTTTSLVFFRTGSLRSSTSTNISFEGLNVADIPEGAYVLVEREKISFMTRVYKYQSPAFVDDPPDTWKKVWTQRHATLFQVRR